MRDLFKCQIRLSGRTLGTGVAIASVALGATFIEKYFTLSRAEGGGVDFVFPMKPEEMKSLFIETERAWQALGRINYGASHNEEKSLKFRRSFYVAEDMKARDVFTEKNLRIVRSRPGPGYGLPPKYYESVMGMKVKEDVNKGIAVGWDLI